MILALATFGCDERLDELNTDKRNPSEVPTETLFAAATIELFDNMASTSVNNNPFRLYSQMWAQTTYPQESQYNITPRSISYNIFVNQYRDVLADLNDAKQTITLELEEQSSLESDEQLNNKLAIINILMGYTYITLVDIFGDVPYSEALDPSNLTPAYDDASSVYDSVEASISAASVTLALNSTAGSFPASQDLVFSGDLIAWSRAANTLKLRMAMKLADVNATKSVEWADEAMTVNASAGMVGVITNSSQNFALAYQTDAPNTNPLYESLVLSGRRDFILANTLTDALNERLDPRITVYGRNPLSYGWNVDSNGNAQDSTFDHSLVVVVDSLKKEPIVAQVVQYWEAPFTISASDSTQYATTDSIRISFYQGGTYGSRNSYAPNSQVGDIFHTPTLEGVLISYTEVEFLMAEMAQRGGYAIEGSAEDHYNAAITASFNYWGVSGVENYLARPEVAYTTADGGSRNWRQIIGVQLWLSLYNQGLEAWSAWRKFDFEGFNPPPGMSADDIPNRMTYPAREENSNGVNYTAAGTAIGGNTVQTKIFWDAN